MESKYKERAREIMWKFPDNKSTIELMCILAEEVEIYQYNLGVNVGMNTVANVYTKEQVEELLQKQRELCAKEAELSSIPLEDIPENCDFMHFQTIDSDFAIVDRDSILNAKLKIY